MKTCSYLSAISVPVCVIPSVNYKVLLPGVPSLTCHFMYAATGCIEVPTDIDCHTLVFIQSTFVFIDL